MDEILAMFGVFPRKRSCFPFVEKIDDRIAGTTQRDRKRCEKGKASGQSFMDPDPGRAFPKMRKKGEKERMEEKEKVDEHTNTMFYKLNDVLANVLSMAPIVPGTFVGPSPAAMAFCPPVFGRPPICDKFSKLLDDIQPEPSSWSMETHQRGILVVTFAQGVMGFARICMGDVFGGIYALLLATLGYNSRIPGPAANWLKTYVLITFINGTVGGVDLFQHLIVKNYPTLSLALPLSVNMAHFMILAVPLISFSGALFGWEFVKAQKALILARQKQMLQLQQSGPALPWPPPPLPAPEVLQRMQQAMDKAHGICPSMRAKMEKEFEEQQAREEAEEIERARRFEAENSGAGLGLGN